MKTSCNIKNLLFELPPQSQHGRQEKAFTLIELLVVISIIALLIAILLPVLKSAKAAALQSVCLSNIRGVGISLSVYADDYGRALPITYIASDGEHWVYPLVGGKYMDIAGMSCPSLPVGDGGAALTDEKLLWYLTYGMGAQYNPNWSINLNDSWNPAKSELLLDSIHLAPPVWVEALVGLAGPTQYFLLSKRFDPTFDLRVDMRHHGAANILFMDMHASAGKEETQVTQFFQYPEYGLGSLRDFYAINQYQN